LQIHTFTGIAAGVARWICRFMSEPSFTRTM